MVWTNGIWKGVCAWLCGLLEYGLALYSVKAIFIQHVERNSSFLSWQVELTTLFIIASPRHLHNYTFVVNL